MLQWDRKRKPYSWTATYCRLCRRTVELSRAETRAPLTDWSEAAAASSPLCEVFFVCVEAKTAVSEESGSRKNQRVKGSEMAWAADRAEDVPEPLTAAGTEDTECTAQSMRTTTIIRNETSKTCHATTTGLQVVKERKREGWREGEGERGSTSNSQDCQQNIGDGWRQACFSACLLPVCAADRHSAATYLLVIEVALCAPTCLDCFAFLLFFFSLLGHSDTLFTSKPSLFLWGKQQLPLCPSCVCKQSHDRSISLAEHLGQQATLLGRSTRQAALPQATHHLP